MRIDYLHAATSEDIFAKAKIVKSGKTIIKVNVELFQNDEEQWQLQGVFIACLGIVLSNF